MAKFALRPGDPDNYIGFKCPGCKSLHALPTSGPKAWKFNGDVNSPTLQPSILSWTDEDKEWNIPKTVCHSFVKSGKIEFLGDCTHELAGKTVELPELEEGWKF